MLNRNNVILIGMNKIIKIITFFFKISIFFFYSLAYFLLVIYHFYLVFYLLLLAVLNRIFLNPGDQGEK